MTTLTRDMVLLLVDGREYRIAYAMGNGEWDVADRFMAVDDDAANAYAEAYFHGDEWYVLDSTGRKIPRTRVGLAVWLNKNCNTDNG